MQKGAFSAITSVLLFSACADDALVRARHAGVLTVAVDAQGPALGLDSSGIPSGPLVERVRRIAARLGVPRTEFVPTEARRPLEELEIHRVDVALIEVTGPLSSRLRMAPPLLHVERALAVAPGNPRGFVDLASVLSHPNAVVAIVQGSVDEADLAARLPPARVLPVPDVTTAAALLLSGQVDVVAGRRVALSQAVEFVSELAPSDVVATFRARDAALAAAWAEAQELKP